MRLQYDPHRSETRIRGVEIDRTAFVWLGAALLNDRANALRSCAARDEHQQQKQKTFFHFRS